MSRRAFRAVVVVAGALKPGTIGESALLDKRCHGTLKGECIRPGTPLSLENALQLVSGYVEQYNTVRLHSSIGYVAPRDKLEGRAQKIFEARDRKLEAAREARKRRRRQR